MKSIFLSPPAATGIAVARQPGSGSFFPAASRNPLVLALCATLPLAFAASAWAQTAPGDFDPAAKASTAGRAGETPAALDGTDDGASTAAEPDADAGIESADAAERYFQVNGDPDGGDDALALGDYATAIGAGSLALGAESLALGHLSTAIGDFSTAIGYGTSSGGTSALAIGGYAVLPEYNSNSAPLIEMVTSANGENATAIGPGASADGATALALGAGAEASGHITTAIGLRAQATGGFSTAVGPWSVADGLGATAMGVAAKALEEDATAVGAGSTALDFGSTAFGAGSFAERGGTAIGNVATAYAIHSVAVGTGSSADGYFGVALGGGSRNYGDYSIAAGFQASSRGTGSVAIGEYAETGGYLPKEPPDDDEPCWICPPEEGGPMAGTLDGIDTPADAVNAVAMGHRAQAWADRSVAIGEYAAAFTENSVALGAGSHADRDNVVSVGAGAEWRASDGTLHAAIRRQIVNVAAGTQDHDAVNVAQLGQFAPVLGGGAAIVDGVLRLPAYSIQGQSYADIGSTFAAIDGRLSSLQSAIDGIEPVPGPPGPPGPQGPEGPAGNDGIGYDDDGKATLTLEGEGGTRVRNVADGVAGTDAVNKRQMDAGDAATLDSAREYTDAASTRTLSSAKAYTDQRFQALNDDFLRLEENVGQRLDQQDRRIDKIGAMSTAMMNMSINAANSRSPRGRVAVGAGWQGGESALSLGYSKAIGNRASISLGGAFTSDESSAGVGFGIDL
ncbi:YadA-like family protein [Luteimonas sp. R10]|uniref:YadA-like family protein n=1 Tax=Luteimonas sp. R10 TaxID=3108176 RepID=UPI003089C6FF|nr:YadA-like family protein [Luteimonas sp. R10]